MSKNNKMRWNTRTLVFIGLLVAMHVVLRFVSIPLGPYRISVGTVCTILTGLWFGPLAGGISGMLADVIGCLLQGYSVNPLITVGAISWGVVPGLLLPLLSGGRVKKIVVLCAGVIASSVMGTIIFTTAGLVLINGYSLYAIIPGRLTQWAVMTPVLCILTCALYLSPLTVMALEQHQQKQKDTVNV